jgi:hypothetical protein
MIFDSDSGMISVFQTQHPRIAPLATFGAPVTGIRHSDQCRAVAFVSETRCRRANIVLPPDVAVKDPGLKTECSVWGQGLLGQLDNGGEIDAVVIRMVSVVGAPPPTPQNSYVWGSVAHEGLQFPLATAATS